jgi:hypothetical protein
MTEETLRILRLNVPLNVRSFCIWLIANLAQRNTPSESDDDYQNFDLIEQAKFEQAALRRAQGLTPVYYALQESARLSSSTALNLSKLLF